MAHIMGGNTTVRGLETDICCKVRGVVLMQEEGGDQAVSGVHIPGQAKEDRPPMLKVARGSYWRVAVFIVLLVGGVLRGPGEAWRAYSGVCSNELMFILSVM
jgi:hypothetical protein